MNVKRIAAIALSMRDFPSLAAKVDEAARWLEHAAGLGADLVVFPEEINKYRGDGPGNPLALPIEEAALDSFEPVARLLELAQRLRVALALPLLLREGGHYLNEFHVFSREGLRLGAYRKICPTPGELEAGVLRGSFEQPLIPWEGLQIGGALCFDSHFEEVFARQAERGANLFLMPSLWPGGRQLEWFALRYGAPIVLAYPAWSRILDLDGRECAGRGYREETLRFGFGSPIAIADLNFDRCLVYDSKPWVDIERKYGRKVQVTFDQVNVLVSIESLSDEITVAEICREFGIEPYPAYLRRIVPQYVNT